MGKIKTLLFSICLVLIGAYSVHSSPVKSEPGSNELRAKVATTYTSQIGVRETLGANDSPEIREYLKVTNVKTPAAWCAAFVAYCYTVNGVDNPRSAWSPAYFSSKYCVDTKATIPLQADVFAVYHNNLGRIAHIGFVDNWPRNTDYFITVEGNTNDNGSREGNGVYKKRRLKRSAYRVARYIDTNLPVQVNRENKSMSKLSSTIIRMRVKSKSQEASYEVGADGKNLTQHTINLFVPYASDKNDLNYPYARWSAGSIFPLMTVNDAAADMFEIGKDYNLVISPVEA